MTTVTAPQRPDMTTQGAPPLDDEFKVVCYFTNWAWYRYQNYHNNLLSNNIFLKIINYLKKIFRQGLGKYLPSDIDSDLCTHIIYGFAVLNGDQGIIKPHDAWADIDNKFYEKVTRLKSRGIKVIKNKI